MAHQRWTEFRVGLFVAVGLVLTMATIFMIGGEHRLFERYYTLYANFESISGLRVGAPVQLAGLKVGYVDRIIVPEKMDERYITVLLRVEREFQDRIRADSLATVETQGLLGDKFIYISMGSEGQPAIGPEGWVPSKETTSIFSLAEKAGEIMRDIQEASNVISELLGKVKDAKGEGDLRASIRSIRNTIEQVEKGRGLLHAVIYDPNGTQAVDDFAQAVRAIREIATGAERTSKGDVGGLMTNLRQASADLKQVLGQIRRGEGTLGKFVSDPALYDDLRSLFGRANRNRLLRAVVRSTLAEGDRALGIDDSGVQPMPPSP